MNVNEIASLGRVAEVQKTFDEIFHGFYQKITPRGILTSVANIRRFQKKRTVH